MLRASNGLHFSAAPLSSAGQPGYHGGLIHYHEESNGNWVHVGVEGGCILWGPKYSSILSFGLALISVVYGILARHRNYIDTNVGPCINRRGPRPRLEVQTLQGCLGFRV